MLIYSARPSNGARELAHALGIKQGGRRITRRYNGTVINWGCIDLPKRFIDASIINEPVSIAEVSNKLVFFKKMKDTKLCPKFTEDRNEAQGMVEKERRVVARTVLNGSSGVGIRVADLSRPLVNAPLYVEYIPKDSEWRVHVFRMDKGPVVVDCQKKARSTDVPDSEVNWEIRNLEGGFIYKRHDIDPPTCVFEVATKCMENLSLDFGAVDIIYNEKRNRAYVLEVNSAPGLEGTTVVKYKDAFKEMLKL
jgi:glutathione synthase/RimK-type ligase-like ATP-grasp enzyme